jgi:hypothetical protein
VDIKLEEIYPALRRESVSMPLPWKGGKWTLRDIVDYDYAAAKAALTNAARLRENWLRNFYRIHEKAVTRTEPPFAFLIPSQQNDLSTAIKMMNILKLGGVEVHRADSAFTAGGHEYPAGTYVIYVAQPYGGYAKALLERQEYPEIRESPGGPLKMPYDVVAHTLPLMMGVEAVRIEKPFQVKTTLLHRIERPKGHVKTAEDAYGYAWGHRTNDDMVALNRLAKADCEVYWAAESFAFGGKTFPSGTMIVKNREGLGQELNVLTQELLVSFMTLKSRPEIKSYALKLPRVGLYKSWSASMDEGWTRWVLEQYEIPYTNVFNKDIKQGELNNSYDVIIFPDLREGIIINGISENSIPPAYAGGTGEAGVRNLKAFVENGGEVITLNSAADFAIKHFHLAVENSVRGLSRKEFFIPGSILQALNETGHPVSYGYGRDTAVFFRRSPVFVAHEGRSVVRYPAHVLLSGWLAGGDRLTGKSAIVDIPYGKGRVILIGFPVLYRGQTHGTFRYLFNAVYYGPAELTMLK